MRRWFFYIIPILVVMLSACHHKPVQKPLVFNEPEKPAEVQEEPPVPFTRDLYNKLRASNIDFRLVQFYIDQQLVLTRGLDKNALTVESGVIKYANGKYVNEILINQLTPCLVDSIDADGFRMKFDKNNKNTLKFINNKYSPDFFIFSGTNWKDGGCDVMYDKLIYHVNCGTCSSASDAKLLVRQSDIDKSERHTITVPGATVH